MPYRTVEDTPAAPPLAGSYHLPTRVRFGRGTRATLSAELAGRPCLVLTSAGGSARLAEDDLLGPALRELDALRLDAVDANPTVTALDALVAEARDRGWRDGTIVAIGGGSVLDAAKALAAGLALDTGIGRVARSPALLDAVTVAPIVALPTTAGSGSEVTPVAVLWHRTPGGGPRTTDDGPAKVSLSHRSLFPVLAIVDPALTDTLRAHQTLATGLDAFNQAAESIWNRHANALTLPLATRAMVLAWHALPALQREPGDHAARDAMAAASLLAGTALGQTRTVACHALSYPLTDRYGVTHGIACAFTMAAVAQHMLASDDGRLAALATELLGAAAPAEALPGALDSFLERLGVAAHVRGALGSRAALLDLVGEVELPERGGNGLRDVDQAARRGILEASWEGLTPGS